MRRLATLTPSLLAAMLACAGAVAETVRCDLAGEVLVYAEPAWCDAHGGRALDRPRPGATPVPAAAPVAEPALSVREAQEMLDALGFDPGPADGLLGPRTRAALQRFMAARGLDGGRRLDAQARRALRQAWGEREETMLPAAADGFRSPPAIR